MTNASVHDSQMRESLVETTDGAVYADSAYRSAEAEALLTEKAVTSQIHERRIATGRSPRSGCGSNTSSAT